jgi:hypothetical protein
MAEREFVKKKVPKIKIVISLRILTQTPSVQTDFYDRGHWYMTMAHREHISEVEFYGWIMGGLVVTTCDV